MSAQDLIPVLVALILATPGFLAWRQSKKNKEDLKQGKIADAEIKFAVQEVHLLVNSRIDELLRVSKAESKAIGVVEGRAEQKGEDDSRTKT